jgi:isopentenyl diphosphate isomerase/L-lactate dehydrogenase-like FMN-dependent dehydrogenase
VATRRGPTDARAAVVVSSRSSLPIGEIVAQAKSPLWFSPYADSDARRHIDGAVAAGCKVICLTVEPRAKPNWQRIETIRRGLNAPIVVKGIATVQDAKAELDQGAKGIVVSDHGGTGADKTAPIEVLPSIVDAVAGQAAVLVDGGFRRGSDIAKALALGANGVLLARPIMWALAAYGADGVRTLLELLQNDLARNMGALGAVNLKALTRAMVRVHRR